VRPESFDYPGFFETVVTTLVVMLALGAHTGTGVAVAKQSEARDVREPGVAARAWREKALPKSCP
jgi:hypothetical protein